MVVPSPAAGPRQKLLDRVRHAIRTRHYSRGTEQAYVDWTRRYIAFHRMTHPAQLGASHVSQFLTWLAVDRRVTASTQNQVLSALLFLYSPSSRSRSPRFHRSRARTPERLPVVLSREEVEAILAHLVGVTHLFVMLLYGSGLRLEECLTFPVKGVDLDRHQIVVRQERARRIGRQCCPRQRGSR
jgi:site-specific recombinase XerD